MLTLKRPSGIIYNPSHILFCVIFIFLNGKIFPTMNLSDYMSQNYSQFLFFLQRSTHWCGEDNGNVYGVINHPTIFYIGMVAAIFFSVFDTKTSSCI